MTEPTPERLAKLEEQLPDSALLWFRTYYLLTEDQVTNPTVEIFLRHVYYGVPPVDPAAIDGNVRTASIVFFDEGAPLADTAAWLHEQTRSR